MQVTVRVLDGIPTYVVPHGKVNEEINRKIVTGLEIMLHGAKAENLDAIIPLAQSTILRTKEAFKAVPVEINNGVIDQKIGRLHFTTTTANNMQKKGRPNPDQKFFVLVVSLYAKVGEERFLLKQIQSAKLIVRASNPAQYKKHVEAWMPGAIPQTIQHQGAVGINFVGPGEVHPLLLRTTPRCCPRNRQSYVPRKSPSPILFDP